MNPEGRTSDEHRYERKFVVDNLSPYEIESLVRLHPAMFFATYPPRFVNNLYFDSFGKRNYFDNVDGLANRAKLRIRWYGHLFGVIEKPILEIKSKRGSVSKKESYPLAPLSVSPGLEAATVRDSFEQSDLPGALRLYLTSLEVSLLNRYHRKYFQSADGCFRITIDTGIHCYHVRGGANSFLHRSVDLVNTVVELKYAAGHDNEAERISNHFRFRVSKNSKYVTGVTNLSLG